MMRIVSLHDCRLFDLDHLRDKLTIRTLAQQKILHAYSSSYCLLVEDLPAIESPYVL